MLENLKIALKRQKKLLLIFFLTILIPSVTLSIFGLRSIRNEQFRLSEQIENDHRRTVDLLKYQAAAKIDALDKSLQVLAKHPSFQNKEFAVMQDLISGRLAGESLLGQVILLYRDEDPIFPLFQSPDPSSDNPPFDLTPNQKTMLNEAEDNEYRIKDYRMAISLYEGLLSSVKNKSFEADMLLGIARCSTGLSSYNRAIQIYSRIADNYPAAVSSSGLPLGLAAELRILECYKKLNDPQKFLESALSLYQNILQKPWNLTRDQYNIYSSMVENDLQEVLSQLRDKFETDSYENEYDELKNRHQKYLEKWEKVENLRRGIVPELQRMMQSPNINTDSPIHRSFLMDGEEVFLVGSWIFDGNSASGSIGLLMAEINGESFQEEILRPVLSPLLQSGEMNVIISSLQGEELVGSVDPEYPVSTTTSFFRDNFPPWKMEFYRSKAESSGLKSLSRSFYFWTILTLLLILTFGSILISRTLSQEMEILKIKSDFVSSVSHELKTPLTSIKALIERLLAGKVKDSKKLLEYYSIISHDTEKLTRLVKNILDFSKIEDGKLEYELAETDIGSLVRDHIEAFRQDEVHKDVQIHIQIAEYIPPVHVDRNALGRAIDNLLNNAVKFSSENPKISVDVRCEEDDLRISVKDRGIGIPEDEIDRIFDKFYQGKSASSLTVKGTGLGLTLVRHIAEAHGGDVAVESRPGQGSTFSLIFPLSKKVR